MNQSQQWLCNTGERTGYCQSRVKINVKHDRIIWILPVASWNARGGPKLNKVVRKMPQLSATKLTKVHTWASKLIRPIRGAAVGHQREGEEVDAISAAGRSYDATWEFA